MHRHRQHRRLAALAAVSLLACGCGPESRFRDYSTPERAAQSFIEAGRIGDERSLRRSVVTTERDMELSCDYADLGDYALSLDSLLEDRAVVLLQTGSLSSPIACRLEADGWKVSLRETLNVMQQQLLPGQRPATPR